LSVSASSRSRAAASASRLAPFIGHTPRLARWRSFAGSSFRRSSRRLSGRGRRLLKPVEEAVDGAALAGVVLQRPPAPPARQVGGDTADFLAQRDRHLTAVRLDLGVARRDDGIALALPLLAHLGDDRRTLLTRLLGDPGSLVTGLGELG